MYIITSERVEQVIGRAIRQCKHYNVVSEKSFR